MKDLILNNLGIGVFVFCLILIVFLISDLKINNIYLENELDIAMVQLDEKNMLLKSYINLVDSLIIMKKISISDIYGLLPEQEIRKLNNVSFDKE